jgi:hypothetical protein
MTVPRAELLFEQSSVALQTSQFELAEALLLEALQLAPDLAEVHANLAWLLERRGDVDGAMGHYERAIELQPDNARIHLNFGTLLGEHQYFQAAEQAYRMALMLDPAMPGAWCNLGALQAQIKEDVEAESSLRRALQLDAMHTAAHVNLAFLLLRKGRLPEGWQHLEFRDWYRAIAAHLTCPRWQGEPLAGRSILVVNEAGYGDVIQFCRYVSVLRRQGAARVDVLCHPALKTLLQTLQGVGRVIGLNEDCSDQVWDGWVPMLSLPFHLGTQLDSVPANIPYLRAPTGRASYWQAEIQKLSPGPQWRVGLVWQGNPDFVNDGQRSLSDLGVMAPLWRVPGVTFFSLQKGRGQQEVQRWQDSLPLTDLASGLHDFADTAAVIEQLDLVISVDTAVAHLAGALGKPCWVLLPAFMTDWRWLEDRSDSPWYPGALRLFRQETGADWSPVIEDVGDALSRETKR